MTCSVQLPGGLGMSMKHLQATGRGGLGRVIPASIFAFRSRFCTGLFCMDFHIMAYRIQLEFILVICA